MISLTTIQSTSIVCGLSVAMLSMSTPARSEPLAFEMLMKKIRRERIASPAQLLGALPDEYRENFALAAYSQTIASESRLVTPENPRLFVFPETMAKISDIYPAEGSILAFINGSPRVEVIEFIDSVFRPHEVTFTPDGPHSDVNLGLCFGCHTGNIKKPLMNELAFRPNWDTYPFWAGLYGSLDGARLGDENFEQPHLKKLLANAKNHPLLSKIPALQNSQLTNGVLATKNTAINLLLSKQNARRLKKIIEATPDFKKHLNILRALGFHGTTASRLDRARFDKILTRYGINAAPLAAEDRSVRHQLQQYRQAKLAANRVAFGGISEPGFDFDLEFNANANAAIKVLTRKMGGPVHELSDSFSMVFAGRGGPGTPAFSDGTDSHWSLVAKYLERAYPNVCTDLDIKTIH